MRPMEIVFLFSMVAVVVFEWFTIRRENLLERRIKDLEDRHE